MLALPQKVEIIWGSKNKKWYESKGYSYTGIGNTCFVSVLDLMPKTDVNVEAICQYCNKHYFVNNIHYTLRVKEKNNQPLCCEDCKYKKATLNKIANIEKLNKIDTFKDVIDGKITKFPDGFFKYLSSEDLTNLIQYFVELLIKDKLINSLEELPEILNKKIFVKYNLGKLTEIYGCLNVINIAYPNKFQMWEFKKSRVPNNFWENDDNVRLAVKWFIEKMYEDKIIKSLDDLKEIDIRKIITSYNLYNLFVSKFNSSPFNLINYITPNTVNEWEIRVSPNGFYKRKGNKEKIMKWFVEKLFSDNVIKSIDEIPSVLSANLFKEYGLESFLQHCFNSSPFEAIDLIYPYKFKPWELNNCPLSYWNDGRNVRFALEWLIENLINDNIIENIKDIPTISLTETLNTYGLGTLNTKYNNLQFLLSFLFPEISVYDFKGKILCEQTGYRFDSRKEINIHKILSTHFAEVKYVENNSDPNNKWYNSLTNEYYVPDWIIDENIIIEYFGLYSNDTTSRILTEYRNKTHNKINYFLNLKDYLFIPIFPSDLKENYKGLLTKISSIKNNI